MHQSKLIFVYSFLNFLLIFSHHSKSVTSQEVENQSGFDYSIGGEKGPEHWGDLKLEWAACKTGRLQSPIDVSSHRVQVVSKSGDIKRSYKPSNATVKNRGHDISIQWLNNGAGMIKINGTNYFLQQGHWHSPSEHTINRRRFALELHMVHQSFDPNATYKIAVIALLYKRDKERWEEVLQLRTVSTDQVKALRIAVHDFAEVNARPLQPLNCRGVHFIAQPRELHQTS